MLCVPLIPRRIQLNVLAKWDTVIRVQVQQLSVQVKLLFLMNPPLQRVFTYAFQTVVRSTMEDVVVVLLVLMILTHMQLNAHAKQGIQTLVPVRVLCVQVIAVKETNILIVYHRLSRFGIGL